MEPCNGGCEDCFSLEKAHNGHLLQLNFTCWCEDTVEFICYVCGPDKSEWIDVAGLDEEEKVDLLTTISDEHSEQEPVYQER